MLYFGQKQSPEPLLQDRVDQAQDHESPFLGVESGAQVDAVGEHNSADFEEKYPVDGDEQESAKAQDEPLVELPLEFVELVQHVGIVALLNWDEFDVGVRSCEVEHLGEEKGFEQVRDKQHDDGGHQLTEVQEADLKLAESEQSTLHRNITNLLIIAHSSTATAITKNVLEKVIWWKSDYASSWILLHNRCVFLIEIFLKFLFPWTYNINIPWKVTQG